MRLKLLFLLSILVVSCKTETKKENVRDTVIRNYFRMIDSSGMYDTADINYKALKAYVRNDTTSLKRLDNFIEEKKNNRPNWELWKSDIPLPQLNQLNVEEAYRFIFSIYGAPYYEAITISKKDTAFKLNYLFYEHKRDSSKFDKFKEFEKNITEENWNILTDKINNADFWNLEDDYDYRGKDGSDLTVIGYYKNEYIEKSHYVHRWNISTLSDASYFVYYKLLNKNERQN
ncbi:MAG TPA: hypothetical protein VHB70_13385 [Parafilimonas sp.]|nr:hypothetical protein [Parafilimonas sp.]